MEGESRLSKLQQKELKTTLSEIGETRDVAEVIALHNERLARGWGSSLKARVRAKAEEAKLDSEADVLAYVEKKFFSPDNTTWSFVNGRLIGFKKPVWQPGMKTQGEEMHE
jgi:hypothetical protein